jgi:hypothetical protein
MEIIPKKARQSNGSFAMHINAKRSIYLQKLMIISLIVQSYVPGIVQSEINKQRAITQEIRQGRVTVHLHCSSTE